MPLPGREGPWEVAATLAVVVVVLVFAAPGRLEAAPLLPQLLG